MEINAFDIARFWSRVEVRKREQCWPWRYDSDEDGYGEFRTDHGRYPAHRVAFVIGGGDISNAVVVRHRCDNPRCCNPDHLLAGTHQDNVADRVYRGRSAKGEANGRAKLKAKDVEHIRTSGLSAAALARHYRIDEATVRAILRGETWTDV